MTEYHVNIKPINLTPTHLLASSTKFTDVDLHDRTELSGKRNVLGHVVLPTACLVEGQPLLGKHVHFILSVASISL